MKTKYGVKTILAILLTSLYLILVFFLPVLFFLIYIFAYTVLILLLKRYELKSLLIWSTPFLPIALFVLMMHLPRGELSFQIAGIYLILLYYGYIPLTILFAYAYRDIISKWIHPNRQVLAIFLLGLMLITGLAAKETVEYCDTIRRAEKGVTVSEISFCKVFDLYNPPHSAGYGFMVLPYYIGVLMFPAAWILYVTMSGMYLYRRRHKE